MAQKTKRKMHSAKGTSAEIIPGGEAASATRADINRLKLRGEKATENRAAFSGGDSTIAPAKRPAKRRARRKSRRR